MLASNSERGPALTSLIFPVFNPGPGLERTLRQTERLLAGARGAWEVLFVCDGCTDGSPLRLAAWASARELPVRVLSHQPRRGKGYAVRRGLSAARGRWRVFTDVDLAYGFGGVLRAAAALRRGAEVVIASRAHPDSRVVVPPRLLGHAFGRRMQGMAFAWLARRLLALPYRDTQAGLKGLSAAAARSLLPLLHCDGFGFDCELLAACRLLGLSVREVPARVRHDSRDSTTTWRSAAGMVAELLAVRRAWGRLPLASETPRESVWVAPVPSAEAL